MFPANKGNFQNKNKREQRSTSLGGKKECGQNKNKYNYVSATPFGFLVLFVLFLLSLPRCVFKLRRELLFWEIPLPNIIAIFCHLFYSFIARNSFPLLIFIYIYIFSLSSAFKKIVFAFSSVPSRF